MFDIYSLTPLGWVQVALLFFVNFSMLSASDTSVRNKLLYSLVPFGGIFCYLLHGPSIGHRITTPRGFVRIPDKALREMHLFDASVAESQSMEQLAGWKYPEGDIIAVLVRFNDGAIYSYVLFGRGSEGDYNIVDIADQHLSSENVAAQRMFEAVKDFQLFQTL